MLPALASSFRSLPAETVTLLRRGVLLIGAIVLPACLLLVAFAYPILQLWLGSEFADGGAGVMRILGVGILFSCVAFAPGSLIDAIGRPDVTAKFALAQVVVFLPLSALALMRFGIEGAAMVWSLRAAVDCAGRLWLAGLLYPAAVPAVRQVAPSLALGGLGLAFAAVMPTTTLALLFAVLALAGFCAGALGALSAEERSGLVSAIRNPRALLRRAA